MALVLQFLALELVTLAMSAPENPLHAINTVLLAQFALKATTFGFNVALLESTTWYLQWREL
jgi:hypothetical protein